MKLTTFQEEFFSQMGFIPQKKTFGLKYFNPELSDLGHITYYEKKDAYLLVIGDYTTPRDFHLGFKTLDCQIRFGIVYDGISTFYMKDKSIQKFYPSAFIAIEENLKGNQVWKKGTHYHGVEFFVNCDYIENQLIPEFPELKHLTKLGKNSAALYLPYTMIDTLRLLEKAGSSGDLTPLFLESKLLECLANVAKDLAETDARNLYHVSLKEDVNQLKTGFKGLATSEIDTIRKARDLIVGDLSDPPTITALCQTLLINESKLTTGFKTIYHMTIGNYIKDYRVRAAANLLSLTELSIEEISRQVGYSHPSNLGKAFKAKYHLTPLQFRKRCLK